MKKAKVKLDNKITTILLSSKELSHALCSLSWGRDEAKRVKEEGGRVEGEDGGGRMEAVEGGRMEKDGSR